MKRGVLFSIITAVALSFTSSSQGQGRINLDNYNTTGPAIIYQPSGIGLQNGVGATTWTMGLYYALGDVTGSVGSDPSGFGTSSFNGLTLATGPGSTTTLLQAGEPGEFLSTLDFTVPGWISGVITVEVTAYSGSDYNSSFLRGHSAAFTITPATGSDFATKIGSAMPGFAIPVPEPSALALMCVSVVTWFVRRNGRRQ